MKNKNTDEMTGDQKLWLGWSLFFILGTIVEFIKD